MSGSFKRIDYSLRPAKHAERRMLCEIFRKLRPFGKIEDYVYVGFGSVWFADFSLFHRALGIRNMMSIEQVESARQRIEDNKPFRIPVDYRRSKDALPDLMWEKNNFIWLDYDDPLSTSILDDLRTVASRARSGTALTVTVQCTKAPQVAEAKRDTDKDAPTALKRFVNIFGADRVSQDIEEVDLYGWPFGALSRTLLLQEIQTALSIHNSNKSKDAEITFELICDFSYEDGAKMTTISGVFVGPGDHDKLQQCNFEALDFLAEGSKSVKITVPKLTAREFKRLESQLPLLPDTMLELGSIPNSEAAQFSSLYRFFPSFAVLEG